MAVAGVVATYYLVISALYLAGFRLYRIPVAAMHPTIQMDEQVVGRLSESYRSHPQRFDLVLFKPARFPGQIHTKRIVGLPREHITIDDRGVMIDGQRLSLPSAVTAAGLGLKKCVLLIPANAVFVLGDNTLNSMDSRHLGPICQWSLQNRPVVVTSKPATRRVAW